ncbi:MAG: alpha/beta fold hydrolase [Saprospiraceae bacterium]|nr:alpha/beta fold hydrolase [Saprospiraceae bacterium]
MAFLSTTDGHQLYYEHHGNQAGPTVLFLHGGPGLGTSTKDLNYFDLKRINVLLLDQRGAGKSQPTGSLANNTSQKLVGDIKALLEKLGIEKVLLFGGSWGSTLALLFAIEHPEQVAGMVLRGLFTASKQERLFFEEGQLARFHPKAVARFREPLPSSYSGSISSYYFQQILQGNPEVQKQMAYELMRYGISVSRLVPYNQSEVEVRLAGGNFVTQARILAHFSIHDFFLPDEFIIDHLHSIQHIPIHIVQGRYDMITTPQLAISLAERFENIVLHLVEGGHSPREEPIQSVLQEEIKKLVSTHS